MGTKRWNQSTSSDYAKDSYLSFYCSSKYKAIIGGYGKPLSFYGADTSQFRGLTVIDYLSIGDDYFFLSFAFPPLMYFYMGDCAKI